MHPYTDAQTATSAGLHHHPHQFSGWYERTSRAILERPKAVDLVVVFMAIGLDLLSDTTFQSTEYPSAVVVMFFASGSLFWRRSYPAAVLALTTVSYGYLVLGHQAGLFAPAFALYAWIVYGRNRRLVGAGTVAAAITVFAIEIYATRDFDEGRVKFLIALGLNLALITGTADRSLQRRRYINEVKEKLARPETEQQLATSIAAKEERARVAREMHDIVAHSVSVMLVQATAAKWVLDISPEKSRTALEDIEISGREALTDLRRVLGLLREADSPDYIPNPTLDKIPELVHNARSAGYHVAYSLEGDYVVPTGVQTTAYRIIQEALTNVMKHAGPKANVLIRVTTTSGQARLRVTDDGRGAAAAPPSRPGHGLIGMEERVRAFGGKLLAQPCTGGGFEVRALLPYLLPEDTSLPQDTTVSSAGTVS